MEAYKSFARVYDMFMDNTPYQEWCAYLVSLLREYGISDGILLDLGCGTGSMTELLSECGFDMIGVDGSEDMLEIAVEKRDESGSHILYLMQDMRELELYGTVRAVVSVCDCINYILEKEELVRVFSLVNNYLDPDGIFIFDCNTEYKYKTLLADRVIAENREDGSFIWENDYDEEERINEYDLTLFIKEGRQYSKYEEIHYQRCYTVGEITAALQKAGLELLRVYDAFTREEPREDSERICFVARERGKQKDRKGEYL